MNKVVNLQHNIHSLYLQIHVVRLPFMRMKIIRTIAAFCIYLYFAKGRLRIKSGGKYIRSPIDKYLYAGHIHEDSQFLKFFNLPAPDGTA